MELRSLHPSFQIIDGTLNMVSFQGQRQEDLDVEEWQEIH